VAKTLTAFHW